MVDSWVSGAVVGTTAPEIGHALPQTVAVLTSDAGQSVSKDIIFFTRSDVRPEVIDATKIIEDYRRFFASFLPGLFRISTKKLPLLSLRPSLTDSGDDEDAEDSGIISLFVLLESGISGIFLQNPRPKCLRLSLPPSPTEGPAPSRATWRRAPPRARWRWWESSESSSDF